MWGCPNFVRTEPYEYKSSLFDGGGNCGLIPSINAITSTKIRDNFVKDTI